IMVAYAIIFYFDSFDESVRPPPSRVILFGDISAVIPSISMVALETSTTTLIISFAALVVRTTLVASPTGLCGLVPYSDFDSDSPVEMDSPEHITPKVASHPSSSSEYPIAPIIASPKTRRPPATLVRPGKAVPFGRPYRTHPNGPRRLLTARKIVGPLPARRLTRRGIEIHTHLRLAWRRILRLTLDRLRMEERWLFLMEMLLEIGLRLTLGMIGRTLRPVQEIWLLRIDSRSVPRVDEEIVVLVGGDSSSSSGTIDGTIRIVRIETTQRQLEADQMIASEERASMAESIRSLRSENLKIRDDRDDLWRSLRRLDSFAERHLGFHP
nr:hypothetical protein [Tanacetum cinerariifolium]